MKSRKLFQTGMMILLIGAAVCLIGCLAYNLLYDFPFEGPILSLDQDVIRQLPIALFQGAYGPYIAIALIFAILLIVAIVFFVLAIQARKKESYVPLAVVRHGFLGLYDKVRCFDYQGFSDRANSAAKAKASAFAKLAAGRTKNAAKVFGEKTKAAALFASDKAKGAAYAYANSDKAMKYTGIGVACAVPLLVSFFCGRQSVKCDKKYKKCRK